MLSKIFFRCAENLRKVSVISNPVRISANKFSTNFVVHNKSNRDSDQASRTDNTNLGDASTKYKIFKDEDAEIILDVDEERQKYSSLLQIKEIQPSDPYEGLNLERGKSGVFDIQDLLIVLKREKAQDIFVAKVPVELNYVQYMCIVSGKSRIHMSSICQFVKKIYKQKKNTNDLVPKVEGKGSSDWVAMDLGNIALHVFSKSARQTYDIDSLWAVGPKYDIEYNKQDPVSEMIEKHSIYLSDLQPAS